MSFCITCLRIFFYINGSNLLRYAKCRRASVRSLIGTNSMSYNLSPSLQSCTGPVQGQNRVFPVKFSTQGKTCFHYREPLFSLQGPLFSLQGFPCEKTSQGKPCFHYREWVCSVPNKKISTVTNSTILDSVPKSLV